MARLRNAMAGLAPAIDTRLGFVTIQANCTIPEPIIRLFSIGFKVVADQMEYDGIPFESTPKFTCLIINTRAFTIELDEGELGIHMTTCVYPVNEMLALADDGKVLLCFFEEMAHCIWRIDDEREVCFKVHEMMQRVLPGIKIEQLYNMGAKGLHL